MHETRYRGITFYFREFGENTMSPTFQELFGPQITKHKEGEAVAALQVRESFLNAYGVAHGGIQFCLCNSVMGAAAGPGVIGVESTVAYLGPMSPGDNVKAVGKVIRDGKTCAFTHADLFVGESLVASASGVFFHGAKLSPMRQALNVVADDAPTKVLSIDDREVEPAFKGDDLLLRRLFHFNFRSKAVTGAQGRLAISLQAQEAYCNDRGFIDAAVYGI